MSKGGLLHHFPTKDRLVEALVTRSAEAGATRTWKPTGHLRRTRAHGAGAAGAAALPTLSAGRRA